MRRIGIPVTLRLNDDSFAIAKKLAARTKDHLGKPKPVRSLLREILEDVLKEAK
jgi:hypothetical protein